jgi:fucose permease
VIKYVSPLYLLTIFGCWCYKKLPGQIQTIRQSLVAQLAIGFIVIVVLLFTLLIAQAVKRWDAAERAANKEVSP